MDLGNQFFVLVHRNTGMALDFHLMRLCVYIPYMWILFGTQMLPSTHTSCTLELPTFCPCCEDRDYHYYYYYYYPDTHPTTFCRVSNKSHSVGLFLLSQSLR